MEKAKAPLPPSPRQSANFLSAMMFWWTIELFKKGYNKVLAQEDLYSPLVEDRSESLGNRLEKHWHRYSHIKSRFRLVRSVLRTFWWEYTRLGLFQLVNEGLIRMGQPLLLGRLLEYFRKGSDMSYESALWCAGGIVILSCLNALTLNHYTFGGFHMGMKVRVSVCSLVYRKALRLSRTALGDTAPGKVVNLLSNDVSRFDYVSLFLHFMWSAPLMSIVITYLLWVEVGWPGIIGIAVVFTVVPIQSYTTRLSSIYRLQTALRTDERVRLMDEVVSGVQVIKMYAWERPFTALITYARRMELKIIRKSAFIRGIFMTFMLFTTRMAMFCTMLAIVLLGGELTASKVFVMASYFSLMSQTMSAMFARGLAEIAETWVAMGRLQAFMMYEEHKEQEKHENNKKNDAKHDKASSNGISTKEMEYKQNTPLMNEKRSNSYVIEVKNATAWWIKSPEASPTLRNVSLKAKNGILVGVVGSVGAGKSSLLEAILGELNLESGSIDVHGKKSYACQEPWVFAGSVKQNILFGQPMERDRYANVTKSCALLKDFEQFPDGDLTIVGDRGASLSGGQKARISLARAVYRRADLYLLDDPLSAVDAHVGRHLFDQCIGPKGILSKSTRILVTHQVHFLNNADWLVIMKDGGILTQGTPEEIQNSGIDFSELIGEYVKPEIDTPGPRRRTLSRTSLRSHRSSVSSLSPSFDEEEEDEENVPVAIAEASSKGKVHGSVFLQYFLAGGSPFVVFVIIVLFALSQTVASGADYWVSYWTSQEELRRFYSSNIDNQTERQPGQNFTASIENTTNYYDLIEGLFDTNTCIYIHSGIIASLGVIALTRSLYFYEVCVYASQKLHTDMFNGLIRTTMRFFDTNPSGRILNRFSKDMGAIDELLPKATLDSTQIIMTMLGSIIVATTVNVWFLAPISGLMIVFLFVRHIYLKTSKNIKRLEGITKSPVFSHLSVTLNGLPTIRAFGAQEELIMEFDNHQDLHSGSWYMFITTSTAFGLVLDVLCILFICFVTFSFLVISSETLGDQVGLAITQSMALTGMMQWGIRQSAEVTNYMMSVERVLEYRDLPGERAPKVPKDPPKTWPEQGSIEFKDVILTYVEGGVPVLKGLTIKVLAQEKVGIVGRTGAGKSSLIIALFKLAPTQGSIIIDGFDTDSISLDALRSKISIIPQDPVLFSGTLRRNLDPFEEYPDSAIWTALTEVEIKDMASGPLGLQSVVMAGGSNFSVGQRQLVCLARAILRNNKVLVLDEATANVDPHTDTLIQRTIRNRFAKCTVLTVAHRLHTIMDSDRVLVMDAGIAAEFAHPHELLQKENSIFKGMVEQTGRQEADNLAKIAKASYDEKKK